MLKRSNDIDLTTRLNAVLDVFENSAAYTAEMAKVGETRDQAEAPAGAKTIWR